jgi:hypothetical protein
MTVSTTIPHSNFGDPECCGCLTAVIRDDLAVISCNECAAVVRTDFDLVLYQSLDNRFRDYTRFRAQETGSPLPHESHLRCIGSHGSLRNVSTGNVQGRADAFIAIRMAVPSQKKLRNLF